MNAKLTFIRHLMAMRRQLPCVLPALLVLGYSLPASADTTAPGQLIGITQSFLEQAVTSHLERSEIQARHEIEIRQIDPRLRLPLCDQSLTANLESPAQPIGRVTIRVRCPGSSPWTVFVSAQVHIYRKVVIATRPLKRKTVLSPADLALVERDIGSLNQGYLSALEQATGSKLTRQVLPDQVLTPAHLEQAEAIHKGDQVVITARSASVSVRMPGEALADGAPGEQIRVRNQRSERVIKARVTGPGQVEVGM